MENSPLRSGIDIMFRKQAVRRFLSQGSGRAIFSLLRLSTLVMLVLGVTLAFAGDDHNPFAGDAKAAKAGEYEFRINCALCHGLGAHG